MAQLKTHLTNDYSLLYIIFNIFIAQLEDWFGYLKIIVF